MSDPQTQQHELRRFRPDIEGLRAVAIVLVILAHSGIEAVSGGYVGVDVFFVISGFLITRQLVSELERKGQISLPKFYARRIKRLLPASSLVMIATLVATYYWMSPLVLQTLATDTIYAALYSINYHLAIVGTDYLAADFPPSALQHYWSLAVEEQFYFIWPAVILVFSGSVISRMRRRHQQTNAAESATTGTSVVSYRRPLIITLALLALVSLAISIIQTPISGPWSFFGLQTRLWELALGGLIALTAERLVHLPARVSIATSWLGIAAIIASAQLYDTATVFPGYAALLPVVGSAAVIFAGCSALSSQAHTAEFILRTKPFQAIGKLSYAWYLWHWPFLMIGPSAFGFKLSTVQTTLLVVSSIIPASIAYVLVEHPVRSMNSLAERPWKGLTLGALLAATVIATALAFNASVSNVQGSGTAVKDPPPSTTSTTDRDYTQSVSRVIAQSLRRPKVPSNLIPPLAKVQNDIPLPYRDKCHAPVGQSTVKLCYYGPKKGEVTIALFGDSHAAHWYSAFLKIAHKKDWRFLFVTKSGCPAPEIRIRVPNRDYVQCDRWRERAFQLLKREKPDLVLMESSMHYGMVADESLGTFDQQWGKGTRSAVRRLRAGGSKVVFFRDVPSPGNLAPICVSQNLQNVRRCDRQRNDAYSKPLRRNLEWKMARQGGAVVVDPFPWFCRDICPVVIGRRLVYRDHSHMTSVYAEWLHPVLIEVFEATLSGEAVPGRQYVP